MILIHVKIDDILQIPLVRNSITEKTLYSPNLVIDEDCAEFSTVRGKGWVCEINNEIAGFLLAHLKDNTFWALCLKPEFEKQGIGK